MEIRQLQYFVNAAKTENFSTAAKMSFVVQSTLSQRIKQLEDELGMPLFDRIGKRVVLSESGKAFLPFAQRAIKDTEDGMVRLSDMRELKTDRIRIGVASGHTNILTDAMAVYRNRYPGVRFEVYFREAKHLLVMLRASEIDLAVTFGTRDEESDLVKIPLFHTRLCLVASKKHPAAQLESITMKSIAKYPVIVPARGMNARRFFEEEQKRMGVAVEPVIEVNDLFTLISFVKANLGVAVLADTVVVREPEVTVVPIRGVASHMDTMIVLQRDSYHRKAVKELTALLQRLSMTNVYSVL